VIKSDELQTEPRNILGMPTLNTSNKLALLWEWFGTILFHRQWNSFNERIITKYGSEGSSCYQFQGITKQMLEYS
jgi:hypothetical protein